MGWYRVVTVVQGAIDPFVLRTPYLSCNLAGELFVYENRPNLLLGKLSCVPIPGHGCTRWKPEMSDSLDSSARCSAAPHKADAAGFCEIMQAISLHEMLSGRTQARVAM